MSGVSLRQPDHAVDPLFVGRWSRRAFTEETISDDDLYSLFEAARWAPSSGNSQPWRFVYAKRESEHWQGFFDLLLEGNRIWAKNAAVLVVILSATTMLRNGVSRPLGTHSFDTGAAWAQLALQAHLLGWGTRAIGGIDRDAARRLLRVPDDVAIEAGLAIGRPGPKEILPADLQNGEFPNNRLPLSETVAEGAFGWR
jgi:nitroreductase